MYFVILLKVNKAQTPFHYSICLPSRACTSKLIMVLPDFPDHLAIPRLFKVFQMNGHPLFKMKNLCIVKLHTQRCMHTQQFNSYFPHETELARHIRPPKTAL